MTPQWPLSGEGRRHQYYVSQALMQRRRNEAGSLPRVPATSIDALATACWNTLFDSGSETSNARDELHRVVKRVIVSDQRPRIEFAISTATSSLAARVKALVDKYSEARAEHVDGVLIVKLPHRFRRYGKLKEVELWTKDDWSVATPRHDQRLVKALVRAHTLLEKVLAGEVSTLEDLAASVGTNRNDPRALLRLALLAPDIQRAILFGKQPQGSELQGTHGTRPPCLMGGPKTALGPS